MINNSNSVYNVNYFIKKFEAIPDEKWTCGVIYNRERDAHCVNGHCGLKSYDKPTDESVALRKIFSQLKATPVEDGFLTFLQIAYGENFSLLALNINDGYAQEYQQPTPKQRILAALYDIKKMQDIDTGAKVKEVIRYVAVPVTISEQAKELVLS